MERRIIEILNENLVIAGEYYDEDGQDIDGIEKVAEIIKVRIEQSNEDIIKELWFLWNSFNVEDNDDGDFDDNFSSGIIQDSIENSIRKIVKIMSFSK